MKRKGQTPAAMSKMTTTYSLQVFQRSLSTNLFQCFSGYNTAAPYFVFEYY